MIRKIRHYLLDRMVLRPSRHRIDYRPQRRIVLRDARSPLECFVQYNSAGDGPCDLVVLKFPGTAGRAERSSSFPLSMLPGVHGKLWTWNPPGYGGSPGRASLARIASAAVDFYQQVIDSDADDKTTVWLCGNSLGCNTALHVASTIGGTSRKIGVLLRNPPPLVPVVKRVAGRYPLGRWLDPVAESICDEMNAMRTARRVSFPAVFLQSQCDTLVPPEIQDELIEVYAGAHRTVRLQGLEHDGVPDEQQNVEIATAVGWLWRQTHAENRSSDPADFSQKRG